MTVDLTADDFITGIVAACRTKGFTTINMRDQSFYERVKRTFDSLQDLQDTFDVDLRFAVFLDPLHHDSPVVERAVSTAVQRKIVSFDNPEFVNMRIKLTEVDAEQTIHRLPGGADLYRQLADQFATDASVAAH